MADFLSMHGNTVELFQRADNPVLADKLGSAHSIRDWDWERDGMRCPQRGDSGAAATTEPPSWRK